jgi:lipid-binding SYLF domain-containing protein
MSLWLMGLVLCSLLLPACSTAPKSESDRDQLISNSERTLEQFRHQDSTLDARINESYGYAVFPTIGKGGVGVGGAWGRGTVWQQGRAIGFTDVTQASIGFQLGGQTYSELLLFDQPALERFKRGEFSLGAQASAVAATAGAAAHAQSQNGVMVFTLGQRGLMYEASVGGQNFTFEPL